MWVYYKQRLSTNFLHCLIRSGFEYSFRHSVMWSPIFMRHCLVCSSCSRSDSPFSGLSSCFRAALTGRILSLHCNIQTQVKPQHVEPGWIWSVEMMLLFHKTIIYFRHYRIHIYTHNRLFYRLLSAEHLFIHIELNFCLKIWWQVNVPHWRSSGPAPLTPQILAHSLHLLLCGPAHQRLSLFVPQS